MAISSSKLKNFLKISTTISATITIVVVCRKVPITRVNSDKVEETSISFTQRHFVADAQVVRVAMVGT